MLLAFVPPTSIASGWLTFFVSFIFIAILTVIVGDVAAIFGCLVGLKENITAILFVALGTSLPDTFAQGGKSETSILPCTPLVPQNFLEVDEVSLFPP